jgi:hypothetical protein
MVPFQLGTVRVGHPLLDIASNQTKLSMWATLNSSYPLTPLIFPAFANRLLLVAKTDLRRPGSFILWNWRTKFQLYGMLLQWRLSSGRRGQKRKRHLRYNNSTQFKMCWAFASELLHSHCSSQKKKISFERQFHTI